MAASVSQDQFLVSTGDDDADVEMEMEAVDLEPRPRLGVPKTMRELAESYAQRQEEAVPPLPPQVEEGDLAVGSRGRGEHVLEEGASRRRGGGPGRRTVNRRPGTRTTRTSNKRTRKRSESEDASDVDGEEEAHGTPPKRPYLEASDSPIPTHAPTPNPNDGSGRVLRPRAQKSAGRLREEREMEKAYRRAVAG